MTGMFASKAINSAAHGGAASTATGQMWFQTVDVLAVFLYCGIGTFIILAILKYTIGIRVSEDVEVEGLDINLHGELVAERPVPRSARIGNALGGVGHS